MEQAALLKRLLVVEDNPGDLLLVCDLLQERLAAPVIAQAVTFAAARKQLETSRFDAVLLDLSLPDRTGEALICDMVRLCADTPLIVLTGFSDFGFGVRSLALGVADYLLKDELNGLSLYKSLAYSLERRRIALELEQAQQRTREFASRLNTVLEEERARIAREIHDEFGQQLAGLKMSLATLKRLPADQTGERINQLLADVDGSITMVRRIASELRPAIIDQLGLLPALEWLLRGFEKRSGISCRLNTTQEDLDIGPDAAINIFRICQEALTNVSRHANATHVELAIAAEDGSLVFCIRDNGRGLSPGTTTSLGLLHMRERATLIGGAIRIRPVAPTGTLIELRLNNYG